MRFAAIFFMILCFLIKGISVTASTYQDNLAKNKELDSLLVDGSDYVNHRTQCLKYIQDRYRSTDDFEYEVTAQYYQLYFRLIDNVKDTACMEQLESLANRYKVEFPNLSARIYFYVGYHTLLNLNYYAKAFDCYFNLDMLMQANGYKVIPKYAEYYNTISYLYYKFKLYDKAIGYLNKAIQVPEAFNYHYNFTYWSINNNLGLYYQALNKFDSSNYFFEKAIAHPYLKEKTFTESISKGNLGYSYYMLKRYDEALPFVQTDYDLAVQNKDWGLAAGAAITLGELFIVKNNAPEAFRFLKKADSLIQVSNQLERREKLFTAWSHYSNLINDNLGLSRFKDSLINAIKFNNETFNNMILLNAQQKEFEFKADALSAQRLHDQTINSYKIYALIIGFLLIFGLAIVYYLYKRREFIVKEMQHKMSSKIQEQELEKAQLKLKSYIQEINDQSATIEELSKTHSIEEYENAIFDLRQKTILTDDQWQEFYNLFEKAFPNFSFYLIKHYSEITPAEQRLLMMSLLNLDNKQIANNLGVQSETVRITWYRLRKKLNINEQQSVQEFANVIWENVKNK